MALYCDRADVYDHGFPRGTVTLPARLASSAKASTDAVVLDDHGFAAGYAVTLRPGPGGALPAPLVADVVYYALPLSDSAFQVAAAPGGAPVNFTTDGDGVYVVASVPWEATIEWASRLVDDMLPAHALPLAQPYPPVVRMTTAELVAGKLAKYTGAEPVAITAIADAAKARLERWARGVPLRGPDVPKRAALAISGASRTPPDWTRYGGT